MVGRRRFAGVTRVAVVDPGVEHRPELAARCREAGHEVVAIHGIGGLGHLGVRYARQARRTQDVVSAS